MGGKLTAAGEIVNKQEEVIQAKEAEVEDVRLQLANKTEELKQSQNENEDLVENVAKMKADNEGHCKDLKTKENVIQWLNKQEKHQYII